MEPSALSKSDYAAAKKMNRSTITRWAQQGRLVLDQDGRVLVEESELRLAATADPNKAHIVKIHEAGRERKRVDLFSESDSENEIDLPKPDSQYHGTRIQESIRYEKARASRAEIELAQLKKELCQIADVNRALIDNVTAVRQTFERIPHELKLRLASESDPEQVRQILAAEIESGCRKVADMMLALPEILNGTQQ